ncbi:MAG: hypothetical protein IPK79_04115 [Vampirovibrionales bacterium]|nr:hypothetical protein [Vampirovibrionales bacterium]
MSGEAKPLVLALLGPDGCGKTALIQALKQRWGAPITYCHLRPRFGKAVQALGQAPLEPPHGQAPRSVLSSTLKLAYFACDYLWGMPRLRRQARRASARARSSHERPPLIIFDRYFHDVIIDPKRYRYAGPPWLASVVSRWIPKPDVMIALNAPPDILRARKQELSPEACASLATAYQGFIAQYPGGRSLDATQPIETVCAQTIEILSTLAQALDPPAFDPAIAPLANALSARTGEQASLGIGPSRYWIVRTAAGAPRWILPRSERRIASKALSGWRPYGRLSALGWAAFRLCYRIGALGLWPRAQALRVQTAQKTLPAFYVGTPCHCQKWLAFDGEAQTGALTQISKWGVAPGASALIARERDALRQLATFPENIRPLAPGLLSAAGNPESAALEALLLTPLSGAPSGRRLRAYHGDFLRRLRLPDKTLSLGDECERLQTGFYDWKSLSQKQVSVIETQLAAISSQTALPAVMAHGDFAPWNLKRQADGQLGAVDWEWARWPALPLLDACYFYAIQSFTLGTPRDALAVIRRDSVITQLQADFLPDIQTLDEDLSGEVDWIERLYAFTLLQMALQQFEDGNAQATPVLEWALLDLTSQDKAAS